VCDLSSAPYLDVTAIGMLRKLHAALARQGASLSLAGAHGQVRDLLRREGFADVVGDIGRAATLEAVLSAAAAGKA
jgi:anti-anti-sigma regulatory factor